MTEILQSNTRQVSAAGLPANWHILSYPRSGNHLVRALIEFCSQRPTEGCLMTRHDDAIAERPANCKAGVINIANPEPLGFKAHFAWEVFLRNRDNEHPPGLVFVTRNPEDAIASQLARKLYRMRWWPNYQRRERLCIQHEVEHYLSLVHLFNAYDAAKKVHVRFEELVAEDLGLRTAQSLAKAMGLCDEGLPSRLDDVKDIAKNSQNALSFRRANFREGLKIRVKQFCDMSELLDRL